MINVISVDVEEYYHAANLAAVAGPNRWRSLPSRVEQSTEAVLELFSEHSVKGTFFVLGYSARRYPQMVREIVAQGHELASHGYGHRIAYQQTEKQFLRDVSLAKRLLEDIGGVEVKGYRAPNFSITAKNPWAYRALVQAGYKYDSSTYPVWHPRYANLSESLEPTRLVVEGKYLMRFPLAVWDVRLFGKEYRLPVAGGAYWRLLPKQYNYAGLRSINAAGKWFVSYFHPWEMDPEQPEFTELPFLKRIRHYGNVASFRDRLDFYLREFNFSSFAEVAGQLIEGSEECQEVEWGEEGLRC